MTMLTEPWVYAWPQSVVAGESVAIHAAGPASDADLEIEADGLRHDPLAAMKADERLQAEVADEDVVHARGHYRRPGSMLSAWRPC